MRRGLMLMALAVAIGGCGGQGAPQPASEPRVVSIVQDDAELLHRSPEQTAETLDDLRELGVDWVRVTAGWSVIAPEPEARTMPAFDATDPDAYPAGAWDALDRLARETEARGMRLNVDVAFWAPRWAVARPGGRATTERDGIDVAKLADFAEAVARRYPQAAAFTVWNEPNHNAFLLPQWELRDGTWVPASPHAYRRMLEAVVPRLKAAAPDALVLIGATSSVGSAVGDDRSERMSPLTFTRELACVDERLRPLDRPECEGFRPLPGDGFSHHPYGLDLPPWAHDPRPETARIGDLDRMTRLLAQLHQRGRTEKDLPLYLTEFGYQTNPPDPTWDVTLEDQARWLPEAERIARSFPSVRGTAQFTVRDLPERPGPDLRTRWRDYQSGLRFEDGRAKSAHAAYALGLTVRPTPAGALVWGLVRPGSGPRPARVSVREPDGSWRVLAELETEADGTFERSLDVDRGATLRLESGGLRGPPVRGVRSPG